jgi:hypothetical protein
MDHEELDEFGGVGLLTCPTCLTCTEIEGSDDARTCCAAPAGWSG